jgi:hypothetical protein
MRFGRKIMINREEDDFVNPDWSFAAIENPRAADLTRPLAVDREVASSLDRGGPGHRCPNPVQHRIFGCVRLLRRDQCRCRDLNVFPPVHAH